MTRWGSWAYAGLMGLGLTMTGIAIVAAPLSALWLALSFWLGRRQETWEGGRDEKDHEAMTQGTAA